MNRSKGIVAFSVTATLALCGTALGQNALGGGRALDGGLSATAGGRINASTQDLQAIVRFNTSAGNALNGPGFTPRITGGSSYPGTINDAISRGMIRDSGIVSRYGVGGYGGSAFGRSSLGGLDRVAALESGYLPQGALTSAVVLPQGTNAADYSRAGDQSVGYLRDRQGELFIARGSALRGLSVEPFARPEPVTGAAPADEAKSASAATYGRVIDELRRASISRAIGAPGRPDAVAPPEFGSAPLQYDPNSTITRLREKLAASRPAAPAATPDDTRRRDTVTTPDPSNVAATAVLTEADINALRSMGLRLETLVPPGASDAVATDGYTRLGQEALASGRFGLADQMFQSALARDRNNVLATAGGIHATMGLGLLMSGGESLRQFFVEHPEMIPVRYNDNLLMTRSRAERLADMLNEDIDRAGGPIVPNAGLTLAYLGRQFDNLSWLNKGLATMAAQSKNDPQGTELHTLLVRVWAEPATPAVPPSPATPEPSK